MNPLEWLSRNVEVWPSLDLPKNVACGYKVGANTEQPSYLIYWREGRYESDKVNRQEWQAERERLGLDKAVEWSGEGLPPIGEWVQLCNDRDLELQYGHDVIGLMAQVMCVYKSGPVDMAAVEVDGVDYCFRVSMLRPVKTERQKKIDAAVKALKDSDPMLTDNMQNRYCETLYDAGLLK